MNYKNLTLEEKWDLLLDGIWCVDELVRASEDVLQFATKTYGFNDNTLNTVLDYYTGYKDFEQLSEE